MNELLAAMVLAGIVPMTLTQVAEMAEDLYDGAADGHAAARALASLEASITRLVEEGLSQLALQEPRARLKQARDAIVLRDVHQTREAANRLCAWSVGLLTAYQPPRVVGPMRLDVLLRDIQIAARAGAPSQASQPLAEARAIWRTLVQLPTLASAPVRKTFDSQLDAIAETISAGDAVRLDAAALLALEGVDDVETALKGPANGSGGGDRR